MLHSKPIKGNIKTKVDFKETVKDIPKGETHYFDMIGTVYTGITTACSRLKSAGYKYKVWSDSKNNQMYVKRLK